MNYKAILSFIFPKVLIPITLSNSSTILQNEFNLSENINSRNYKIVKVSKEIRIEYKASSCLEFSIQPYLFWVVGVIKLDNYSNQKHCEIRMTNWYKCSVSIIYILMMFLIIATLLTDPESVWFPLVLFGIIVLILKLAANSLVKYVSKMIKDDLHSILLKCKLISDER